MGVENRMNKKNKKRGISLIVLIITIIVMLILATVIVMSLSNNNVIDKANTAVTETNLKTIEQAASVALGELILANDGKTEGIGESEIINKMKENGVDPTESGFTVTYDEETGKISVTIENAGNVNTDWVIAIIPEEADGEDLYILAYIGESTSVTLPCNTTMVVNIVDPSNEEEPALTGETITLNIGTDYSNINGFESDIVFFDTSIITSITIPGGSNYLSQRGAFDGFSNLQQVSLSEGITEIGQEAFYNCTNLSTITLPSTLTIIKGDAFYNCTSLSNITIPSSVTNIGVGAFWACSGLTDLTISNGVISIGDGVFHRCTNLTSVTIPSSVTSIGMNAFIECTNLTNITVNKAEADCTGFMSGWNGTATVTYNP